MGMILDLSGVWQYSYENQSGNIPLPGTLDENGIGYPDDPTHQWKVEEVRKIGFYRDGDPVVTRLTRKHNYEGPVHYTRRLAWKVPEGQKVYLEAERSRAMALSVNGQEIKPLGPVSISAPWSFDITEAVTGEDLLDITVDNSYPGWPRDAIVYASAASDETQTNWNGILGRFCIRTEKPEHISGVRVYPHGRELEIRVDIEAAEKTACSFSFVSEALAENGVSLSRNLLPGKQTLLFDGLKLSEEAEAWDAGQGRLYDLTVLCDRTESRTVSFGIRDFKAENGFLTLNGHRFFLRGEANCAVFPETGHMPMNTEEWKRILNIYSSYGVNCMRFHSHCPPEAAFIAADELGMLMQPECSHWDPEHAFGTEEARHYYRDEVDSILLHLANHPSFVMLTLGNELNTDEAGFEFMGQLIRSARETDATRLYAIGSNTAYGEKGTDPANDFYTSTNFYEKSTRATSAGPIGWLNSDYPDNMHRYDDVVEAIRKVTDQPVFSFEVGQYEVLPDFGEIPEYRGVTAPENLKHMLKQVKAKGMETEWSRMVEATGESSLLCYRADVESAMGTRGYSGISLLGLQDFPGQGTALVGMMNAHLQSKPFAFAQPERFRAFFRDVLPMVLLPKYTFQTGEKLHAALQIANYSRDSLEGTLTWTLTGENTEQSGAAGRMTVEAGELMDAGWLDIETAAYTEPVKLDLTVDFAGNTNHYPLWIYPECDPACPEDVYECRILDEKAEQVLQAGGKVYLSPEATAEAIPHSIKTQFSPDFWSVCTFPDQAGGMGQLMDTEHPLFDSFPTDSYNNWQWWPMATQRAMVLPEKTVSIIAEMDSYAFLRPMAKLFECRCGGGKLMVSSMGLQRLTGYPEGRALQKAIYDYMGSGAFQPTQERTPAWIRRIFDSGDQY